MISTCNHSSISILFEVLKESKDREIYSKAIDKLMSFSNKSLPHSILLDNLNSSNSYCIGIASYLLLENQLLENQCIDNNAFFITISLFLQSFDEDPLHREILFCILSDIFEKIALYIPDSALWEAFHKGDMICKIIAMGSLLSKVYRNAESTRNWVEVLNLVEISWEACQFEEHYSSLLQGLLILLIKYIPSSTFFDIEIAERINRLATKSEILKIIFLLLETDKSIYPKYALSWRRLIVEELISLLDDSIKSSEDSDSVMQLLLQSMKRGDIGNKGSLGWFKGHNSEIRLLSDYCDFLMKNPDIPKIEIKYELSAEVEDAFFIRLRELQRELGIYNYEIARNVKERAGGKRQKAEGEIGERNITYQIGSVGNFNTGNVKIYGDQVGTQNELSSQDRNQDLPETGEETE